MSASILRKNSSSEEEASTQKNENHFFKNIGKVIFRKRMFKGNLNSDDGNSVKTFASNGTTVTNQSNRHVRFDDLFNEAEDSNDLLVTRVMAGDMNSSSSHDNQQSSRANNSRLLSDILNNKYARKTNGNGSEADEEDDDNDSYVSDDYQPDIPSVEENIINRILAQQEEILRHERRQLTELVNFSRSDNNLQSLNNGNFNKANLSNESLNNASLRSKFLILNNKFRQNKPLARMFSRTQNTTNTNDANTLQLAPVQQQLPPSKLQKLFKFSHESINHDNDDDDVIGNDRRLRMREFGKNIGQFIFKKQNLN